MKTPITRRSFLSTSIATVPWLMWPGITMSSSTGTNSIELFNESYNDTSLQTSLGTIVANLGLDSAVKNQHLGLTLVDITNSSSPRLASLNGGIMFYAASLPKIVILLGAFHKAEAGQLELTPLIIEKLTQMVRFSSNTAATEMMHLVGMDYIASVLQSEDYKFYDIHQGGGLWLGKAYAKTPAWKRDPLFNLSHGATSLQVAKFYYLLATQQLLSKASCDAMLKILSKPGINHKFVKGILTVDDDAKIFRKSGSWRDYHSDSALIERDGHRYIAVALARSQQGESWLQQLIVKMDKAIVSDQYV